MTEVCMKMERFGPSHTIRRRVVILRKFIRLFSRRFLACSAGKPIHYRMLSCPITPRSRSLARTDAGNYSSGNLAPVRRNSLDMDADLVSLKISILGDCEIGKTSFLVKYAGSEKEQVGIHENGISYMDKTLVVGGARISYSIWEVEGNEKSKDQIPMACNDSVAILIMFDLTSRCTLNSVISWYQRARACNQTAIPVLIGTKFDEFIQLPIDLQWTIASQARAYAKAINASVFFSSATYNINVNKIFKFVTAKLFDLPWSVERNLTIGEPIIDF